MWPGFGYSVTEARTGPIARLPTGHVTVLASANHFWYPGYRIASRTDTTFA
jgi:hypothetical protein